MELHPSCKSNQVELAIIHLSEDFNNDQIVSPCFLKFFFLFFSYSLSLYPTLSYLYLQSSMPTLCSNPFKVLFLPLFTILVSDFFISGSLSILQHKVPATQQEWGLFQKGGTGEKWEGFPYFPFEFLLVPSLPPCPRDVASSFDHISILYVPHKIP